MTALNIDAQSIHGATFGELEVTTSQKMEELASNLTEQLAGPPPMLHARVTDGSGNVYEGTLHLVEQKVSEE